MVKVRPTFEKAYLVKFICSTSADLEGRPYSIVVSSDSIHQATLKAYEYFGLGAVGCSYEIVSVLLLGEVYKGFEELEEIELNKDSILKDYSAGHCGLYYEATDEVQ